MLQIVELETGGVLNETTSVMLVGIPWKQSVKQIKEIETYPLSSFVGEVFQGKIQLGF